MRRLVALVALALVVLAACSSGDGGSEEASPRATSTTTATPDPFVVLVSNDDGVGAEGIDALVEALRRRDDVDRVVVVAPAENQSGAGDATTPNPTAAPATTRSGYAAVAVTGKPADAVNHALDVVLRDDPPDLVVTGVNEGQNLGPIVAVSGTVGAARTAARRGIPALAVSQGLAVQGRHPDYATGVRAAMAWLDENLGRLRARTVASINAPTCTTGSVRGTVDEPTAADTASGNPVAVGVDCASTATGTDDISAFNAGYVVVSDPGLG